MPHFFVPPENVKAGRFVLAAEESRHLVRVLRKKAGDEVRLFDGVDRSFRGVLEDVSSERVSGRIVAELTPASAPYVLRLFQGVPKGNTLEWIIEKATELGVSEIVPLHTLRSVARVPAARTPAKLDRWEKIARAAAAQCGRADVPILSAPVEFNEALARFGTDELSLIAWEGEETKTLKSALSSAGQIKRTPDGRMSAINVMIGAEGGFDPGEVERARARGVIPVTLGPRVLRTETAGIFVASSLLYELGL